jgi:hypothetical protein
MEDNPMTTRNLSRRAMIAGAAVLSTTTIPATAIASGNPLASLDVDPIFAAIEAREKAYVLYGVALDHVSAFQEAHPADRNGWRLLSAEDRELETLETQRLAALETQGETACNASAAASHVLNRAYHAGGRSCARSLCRQKPR